jgi:hypothetical protein
MMSPRLTVPHVVTGVQSHPQRCLKFGSSTLYDHVFTYVARFCVFPGGEKETWPLSSIILVHFCMWLTVSGRMRGTGTF